MMRTIYRMTLAIALLLLTMTETQGQPWHVVILGDSNTFIGGDACDQPRGWNKWFKEAFAPASCRSYARSGATWTNTEVTKRNTTENIGVLGNDNVVYNQIERLKDVCLQGEQPTPDLIIISAGTNDAWFVSQRPQVFAQTVDGAFADEAMVFRPANEVLTLAESVRYGCELLKTAFPEARIILLTPLQATKADAQLITKAGDIIEACARRMALGVIRLDQEGCIKVADQRSVRKYTTDGVHTNVAGARYNGLLVARRVKEMIKK